MTVSKTCEFVSPRHPDKICDFIADSILDAFIRRDRKSRVAIQVLGGHNKMTITGEVTSRTRVDMARIARRTVGKDAAVDVNVVEQSPFIGQGVAKGGAGDQGIMIGYATAATRNLIPFEYEAARNLCMALYAQYPGDGKVQVTIRERKILAVVASFHKTKTRALEKLVRQLIDADEYYVNPGGEWPVGGFDADSGLTGKKIVVDSYGPEVPVGGGSFSGKDPTKVDRSGAYMARKIAVDLLRKHKAGEVLVKLAYAIGKPQPLMAVATIDLKETEIPKRYDLTPAGIIKFLKLDRPIYAKTSTWGHFGRGFPWDK
jgi:S-adenosylmethionine synthetase